MPPLNAVTANSDYAGLAEGQYEVTDEDAAGNAGASAYSQLSTVVGPGVVEYVVQILQLPPIGLRLQDCQTRWLER